MRIIGPATLARGSVALGLVLVPLPALAANGLVLFPEPRQLAVNIALFLVLIYPVNRLLLRPLVRILEERELRTQGALARAEDVARKATALRSEFEHHLVEARSRATQRRLAILAEGEQEDSVLLDAARSEATQALESVRRGIQAELQVARQGLRVDAAELGREAASRILGRSL